MKGHIGHVKKVHILPHGHILTLPLRKLSCFPSLHDMKIDWTL